MTGKSPTITLNNGVPMPALGLGVYQSSPQETAGAVEAALREGYRLIDTAAVYGNEKEVGEGLARSGVDRGEVFVTTKLWLDDYGYDAALRAFDTSMANLGLDHLDLYLLHWPAPASFEETVASYRAAEQLLADGRVRAIGVCNHTADHLRRLVDRTGVVPAVNQVELHPYFTQRELREAGAGLGVVTQSWSPLGGVNTYWEGGRSADKNPLDHPAVHSIAARHRRTPAQVVLRWHLDHGLATIPKSVRPQRIAENFDVFGFSLSAEEVASIDAIDSGVRGGPDPDAVDLDTWA
ncbi:aldo/keto reductase [Actinacidiphila bryophytorum]|uniref:Morphine 6-dehydrogenase n=1 Tax=Actinacidiphila bryophytorum TaxID=1436133 RepID=A0A9W4ED52_9ACTN|nr:aldo/keto reductase [Actinacidiphila bryophytorum]MBM9438872.1 aldo/keto reductase [Actinacidiphila bryophytorum]MBN6542956.1 aldo/keto reductase [Actinacidiphila bryophytorum]CAG7615586.1 Morphine 6-dehydrogenase [Actinacidiphila bryophytorum]